MSGVKKAFDKRNGKCLPTIQMEPMTARSTLSTKRPGLFVSILLDSLDLHEVDLNCTDYQGFTTSHLARYMIGSKREHLDAVRECLLASKDMGDPNHGTGVYRFIILDLADPVDPLPWGQVIKKKKRFLTDVTVRR